MVLFLACTSPSDSPAPSPAPVPAQPAPAPEPEPLPDPTEPVLAASHIQVPWTGSVGADPAVERTEAEARALADRLVEQLDDGADFASLAREHSADPSGRRGGRLGSWRTGLMDPDFERCVAAAEVGGLGPVCRTPFGWHVIRRDPVAAVVGGQHWALPLPDGDAARDEARARAAAVRQAWIGGTAPEGATPIDPVVPEQLLPAVEQALRALDPGAVSEVVETADALHLVRRSAGSQSPTP